MIFLKLLNMSITASWLVLAVVVLRLLLKKAPKYLRVLLWAMVGIRLICPFSIESALSLIPSTQPLPEQIITDRSFEIDTGISFVDEPVNEYLSDRYYEGVTVPAGNGADIMTALTAVWLTGMIVMLAYTAISYLSIRRKVQEAVPLRENIFLCDRISTPFILGIFRPKIYLPSDLGEADSKYVVAHEKAHLKRLDHWWKPLGFLLLTVHWFNPVLWLAYLLLCRDIEYACDEKVLREMGTEIKKPYSDALINCSISRRMIAACPLAFGEAGVKGRIRSVLNYKKPAFWIILAAAVVCAAAAVCFLTDPRDTEDKLHVTGTTTLKGVSVEITEFEYKKDSGSIMVTWTNDTDKTICFGEAFTVSRDANGTWVDCAESEPVWTLPAYLVLPGESTEKEYRLSDQDMTAAGRYRWEAVFSIKDDYHQVDYFASVEFELDETHGPLYYKNAFSTAAGKETVLAVHCPESDENGESKLLMGEASGALVAGYIANAEWKPCEVPLNPLSSPGSVEFILEDDYRITVYQRKKWALHTYAAVRYGKEERYFRIGADDYRKAADLLKTPGASVGGADGPESVTTAASPPELSILYLDRKITANRCGYDWMTDNRDGTASVTQADSNHPLALADQLQELILTGSTLSALDPNTVYLDFGITPDVITVHCWDLKDANRNGAKSEMIPVTANTAGGLSLKLKDGEHVYEVVAEFNRFENYGGTVHYAFRTSEPEIIDIE